MTGPTEYETLTRRLTDAGHDIGAVEAGLRGLTIETPSWGFGDSGTRFGVFPQAGRPRDVFERIDDAAKVYELTGSASAVALHFPWDAVDDVGELRAHIQANGLTVGAINPNLFQEPEYRLGSISHPDARVRARAVAHLLECIELGVQLGSTGQSIWLADGTNYAGQDGLRERRLRVLEALGEAYSALPEDQEMLLEYKPFEPAFYATDLADWGSSLLMCQRLGERAKVLVDLGHHLHGVNVEQIVGILAEEGRLGGFHFNNRKYADDDLIVGSTNPFELFLIFAELLAADEPLPRLVIDQAHNVEPKVEAITLSVMNLQEAYVKARLIDVAALRSHQQDGDVLAGHSDLLAAYATDVRALCAKVREEIGAAADPLAALRASNYVSQKINERGGEAAVGVKL
jgi:L-rhamnose isomerase/sugar isomerase